MYVMLNMYVLLIQEWELALLEWEPTLIQEWELSQLLALLDGRLLQPLAR